MTRHAEPLAELRTRLLEAAIPVAEAAVRVAVSREILEVIVDAQMAVFADVTIQPRRTARGPGGTWIREHRLVALTPFEPIKDTPDA